MKKRAGRRVNAAIRPMTGNEVRLMNDTERLLAVAQARKRLAAKLQSDPGADVTDELREVAAAQRELAATPLGQHIREVVDAAPTLTDEQCARLASLLHPGPGYVAADD
jgi:hypothetical protein